MTGRALLLVTAALLTACTATKKAGAGDMENPPIITSASYQHTLYTGLPQAIDARAAKDAPLVVTYFTSEADLERNTGGTTDPPTDVGVYYARIERPAFNGYRAGPSVKVEYRIQKPLPAP
jgi:hypothetical protein